MIIDNTNMIYNKILIIKNIIIIIYNNKTLEIKIIYLLHTL